MDSRNVVKAILPGLLEVVPQNERRLSVPDDSSRRLYKEWRARQAEKESANG